ncbi:MAG: hypothetical protein ABR973_12420 [Candidatus Acidiferrales bacterium]
MTAWILVIADRTREEVAQAQLFDIGQALIAQRPQIWTGFDYTISHVPIADTSWTTVDFTIER